jgi:4-amino-4-deoxy-L-arabinose transferase-like glycosyltransferase
MVYWRTCGSYGQLLDCLRTDGFVPLHYSLVWGITRFARPTPFTLRFVPALCGTLMVPTIYFLARQMLARSTALLAAAFTACSAFMLFYSRDAKMYMLAWLFVALNTACLLWWFRSRKSTAWLCWIATGSAACGLHFSSAVPVAISVLLLLTQRTVRWQMVLLWTLGVVLILAGPVGYYAKFNTWKDRTDENWNESGLQWIGAYNWGRTGPQLVRCLSTSTLMGWEWPKDADVDPHLKNPAPLEWPARAAEVLLGIFVVSALPWPLRWRSGLPRTFNVPRSTSNFEIKDEQSLSSASFAPDDSEPQWRVALWLSFLIVLPVYGFYCHSTPGFASPLDWGQLLAARVPVIAEPFLHPLLYPKMLLGIEVVSVAVICLLAIYYPGFIRGMQMVFVIAAILGLLQVIAMICRAQSAAAMAAGKPWESIWVPRYIGFIWPALAVAVASLLMRLPTRPVRWIAIAFVLGLNLGVGGFRIFGQTEPPVDRMAGDVIESRKESNHTLAWMHLRPGEQSPGSGNLFSGPGEYYLDLLSDKKTTPVEFKQSMRQARQTIEFFPTPWYRPLAPDVKRVIIWSQYESNSTYRVPEKPAPPGWTLQNEQWFVARDCWIWQELSTYRRQVWTKDAGDKTVGTGH